MFQSATQHFNLFVYYSFFIPIMLRCRISTSIAFAVVDRCFVVKKKVRTVQRTEAEEILHHGFRMQFTETEKQTALAKPTVL
ncbi:hypothetical protein [Leptospira borgpetersenii]|nr:hypothetical protein [Leptospira borgpetersenii]MBE8364266.1 hypothetical protein [Leptospira borgpetersenii serovar Balcanica]MBE8368078.1 hypothetical protein [Leptospira borgpetersenii serovar Balcanica]MBE8423808.1 hypothetical protein [Leptospira borgpetersenii serovar Balcanica]